MMKVDQAIALLRRCTEQRNLQEGRRIHALLAESGLLRKDVLLGNKLIHLYARCGSVEESRSVFDSLLQRRIFSWSILISAYIRSGNISQARQIFERMPERNDVCWNALVSAYAHDGQLDESRKLIAQMPEPSTAALTALINALAQPGKIRQASEIFDLMIKKDLVAWNVMISAYTRCGLYAQALDLFRALDLQPDHVTFLSAADACSELRSLPEARLVAAEIAKTNLLQTNPSVGSAMISMFGKCGSFSDARDIFDRIPEKDTHSWNAMITAYAQNKQLMEARVLFDEMGERSLVSWNAMISAYAQSGEGKQALELFKAMDLEGTEANTITFTAAIDACTSIAALDQGKLIQTNMMLIDCDELASVALIKLYAKCGSLEGARSIFDEMRSAARTLGSWNTMIASYANNAQGKKAIDLFKQMILEGISTSSVTFITVLSSCSREGLLASARSHFQSISQDHGLKPSIDHYICLLDLLGRSGRVRQAEELINFMPFQPDATAWRTLRTGC